MSERERDEAKAAEIYAALYPELASEVEPLGEQTCQRCFGVHARWQCPNNS